LNRNLLIYNTRRGASSPGVTMPKSPTTQISEDSFHNAPYEVEERVVNFLHNDYSALCASSLVHRRWISATRYHLFGRTVISQLRDRGGVTENISTFLTLLDSPHCMILTAIRSIILTIVAQNLVQDVVGALAGASALKAVVFVDSQYSPINPSPSVP